MYSVKKRLESLFSKQASINMPYKAKVEGNRVIITGGHIEQLKTTLEKFIAKEFKKIDATYFFGKNDDANLDDLNKLRTTIYKLRKEKQRQAKNLESEHKDEIEELKHKLETSQRKIADSAKNAYELQIENIKNYADTLLRICSNLQTTLKAKESIEEELGGKISQLKYLDMEKYSGIRTRIDIINNVELEQIEESYSQKQEDKKYQSLLKKKAGIEEKIQNYLKAEEAIDKNSAFEEGVKRELKKTTTQKRKKEKSKLDKLNAQFSRYEADKNKELDAELEIIKQCMELGGQLKTEEEKLQQINEQIKEDNKIPVIIETEATLKESNVKIITPIKKESAEKIVKITYQEGKDFGLDLLKKLHDNVFGNLQEQRKLKQKANCDRVTPRYLENGLLFYEFRIKKGSKNQLDKAIKCKDDITRLMLTGYNKTGLQNLGLQLDIYSRTQTITYEGLDKKIDLDLKDRAVQFVLKAIKDHQEKYRKNINATELINETVNTEKYSRSPLKGQDARKREILKGLVELGHVTVRGNGRGIQYVYNSGYTGVSRKKSLGKQDLGFKILTVMKETIDSTGQPIRTDEITKKIEQKYGFRPTMNTKFRAMKKLKEQGYITTDGKRSRSSLCDINREKVEEYLSKR